MSQSQSEQPLGAFFVDVLAPSRTESPFRCLAELADQAFTLANEQAGSNPSEVPTGLGTRYASILYPIGNDVEPFPVKAVLHQNMHAMQIQQVVINFQTRTAECEGQPNLPIEPEQIEYVQEEIKPYLQDVWKRKRAKEKARQWQENAAWVDFLERLESHGLSGSPREPSGEIIPSAPYLHRRCPLCRLPVAPCTSCHLIMCLSVDCLASRLVPFRSCSYHVYTAACLPCLETAKNVPSLGQCPDCDRWLCHFELTWCLGRPKDYADGPPRTYVHRIPSSAREHAIKPIRCSSCSGGQDRPHCSNGKCWSRMGGHTSVCNSCSPGGGLWCTCEQSWICDDCKTSPTENCFKDCPRCKRVYCVYECEYIHYCAECGLTTLCNDCAEEEPIDCEGTDPDATEGVVLQGECKSTHCRGEICGACLEVTRCTGCSKTFCSSCLQCQRCSQCDGQFCSACYHARERRCSGCADGQKA